RQQELEQDVVRSVRGDLLVELRRPRVRALEAGVERGQLLVGRRLELRVDPARLERAAELRVRGRRERRAAGARRHLFLARGGLVALLARAAFVVGGDVAHVLVVLRANLQILLARGDRLIGLAVLAIRVGQLLVRDEVALGDLLLRVADGR